MPIASKRRPDTLELEVLRTSEATKYEKSWRDGQSKRKRITETTKRSALTDNVLEPLQCDNDDDDHHHHYDKIQRQRSSHWYQFGNKFLRRCNLIGGDNANSNQTSKSKSFDEVSDFNTAKINVNMGTATLAKPEGTIIGNSTSTILTTTPPQQQQQEEQQPAPPPLSPLALSQNSCIPDVVTILPRTNSKKRRRSKTDNLYNLNNIDQADDIEQLSPVQCTSVAISNVQTIPISIAKIPVTVSVPIPSSSSSYSYDQTLLTAMEQQKSIPLPKPSIKLKQQQDIETNVPLVKSDIKVNFLSFLSRLTHWKANNCQCNHKHIAKHPYKATNINVGDDINPDDNCNTIDSTSLETQKSINLSNEFHVLPSHANENECMISLANVKEKGIRRLSQIRRRRSSFYYSENERRIRANDREFNGQFKYADNYIKTSKYTLITFLPLNLLEQFQRLANFYFLCLLVLQLIPAISSLTPVTTAIPLIGVLTLTAVKDAYDDIQRHVSDSQVNNRKSKALRNGKLVEEKWSDVQVGDVIHLENNQFVAADILLLSTSEPNGLCFIETAELDGETNLKCKQCLTETNSLGQRQDSLWHFNGEIVCEKPNNLLNKFEGTLTWHNKRYALDNEKILLRGCVLRNTQWCYGMVIFAGKDTKLMQNSGKTQFKSTGVDRLLNFIIIGIVLFLLSICAFFTIACAIWEGIIGQYFQVYLPWEHIIPKTVSQGAPIIGFLVFFSYAIVLNTVVPISLYVSVEVIRFVQSFLINWDEEMYYEPSKTHAKARTTTLNEELGQIQYIFSDKTGTLTQNIMTFNKCSINGHTYGDIIDATGIIQTETDHHVEPIDFSSNPEYEPDFRWFDKTLLEAVLSGEKQTHKFFRLLSLCHTVMPEYVNERLEYQAQSPDEAALVSAARNFGFVFRSRTPNSITIEVMGHKEDYTLLHILDFNNVRKRMSVILRRNNQIVLYCKGADSVIYDRLSSSQTDIEARTQEHLNKFASEGLRTLVLAERYLSLDFYEDWSSRHYEASTSLNDREKKLNDLYEEVESDLLLIGVTAIEDKLQDGVPETIANLQMAGIKIWVLTGDKQETAINIGYSCQLLTDDLADVFIVDGTTKDEVDKQLKQFKESVRIVNRFKPNLINTNANHNANGTYSDSSIEQQQQQQLQQISSPPAVSVVTFRWADDDTKSRGEPYSAETNELYDNMEKADGKKGRGATNHGTAGSYSINKSLASMDADVEEMQPGFAIVINGHSLVHCLSTELEARFLSIASKCKAVICCRVTPLQKALVVELIKRAKSAVTLAIGDGANDVSMIKAAHIGVGISGQEGLQAVLASDYSIAQFRYLERLLLVHGRWSYYRMCKFLRYFFYKNFAFTLCHCWYSMFCGFSAQTVFDPMFISVYNLFYTSLPVLALGVFEQDVSDKHSLEFPKLYTPGLKSQLFNIREFVYSVLHGAFSSLILFLIPYGTYHKGVSPNGLILSDHMTLGAVVATILIIDNTAQIALYTSYWTVFNHITIWGSLIWYFVLDYFYNYVVGGPYVGSLSMAMKDLTFWATMIITVVVIMLPVLAYKFYLADKHPSLADKIRMKRRMASIKLRQTSNVMRAPSARRSGRSLRSGYAFAHQEGFGRLITSGKIMGKLPQEFAFPLSLGGKKNQNSGSGNGSANQLQDNKGSNNNLNNIKLHSNFNHSDINLNRRNYDGPSFSNSTSTRNDNMFNLRAPYQGLDTINL